MTEGEPGLRAELHDGRWRLAGVADGDLINGYLGYLADRGFSAQTVRAYAFDLLAFARWLAGRAGTCTRSAMAAAPVTRRPPSTGGWPRSRACSGTGRCETRPRRTRSRAARRPGGQAPGTAAGCWPIWAGRSGAPGCGSASRGGSPAAWTGPRPPRCWPVSAPTGTGRSPG